MSSRPRLDNQRGMTLVGAIFILTVLAALGAFMVKLSGVQGRTALVALQSAQAYHAARGGLEWEIVRALAGSCDPTGTALPVTLDGFSVSVGCVPSLVFEGGVAYRVYRISAEASRGSYGQLDYVRRSLEVTVHDRP